MKGVLPLVKKARRKSLRKSRSKSKSNLREVSKTRISKIGMTENILLILLIVSSKLPKNELDFFNEESIFRIVNKSGPLILKSIPSMRNPSDTQIWTKYQIVTHIRIVTPFQLLISTN